MSLAISLLPSLPFPRITEQNPKKPCFSPSFLYNSATQMENAIRNDQNALRSPSNPNPTTPPPPPPLLSKTAQKKLLKQQRFEARKSEKKAQAKEQKRRESERKRKEWEKRLASLTEEEKTKLIESRKDSRKERMAERSEERERKTERLMRGKEFGQNIVVDLEFSHLMMPNEIHSLVQQIMYCYAVNGRCNSPAHLWLTGCNGEMRTQLERLPGFDKWIIEKESQSYIEALQHQKENLVYLTADSETVLDELDLKKIYIVGGLVDRNRWKGITMKKAEEQGIHTAKLPIGSYLKMSSSQVLTVNQVVEILLKFLETRDWKISFFEVIPSRKRCEVDSEEHQGEVDGKENKERDERTERKKTYIQVPTNG
ncbi:tRNA_m1G_MT domain-containing protein [Cephalotus follicularis]|uniref:tRNA (guanine(9)-N(1))-methyltransferase n=1 Tax=Cephalotus follicularis TaxID=3775 RepID=A0A1Q3AVS3_CEPFO|nr:tRNA_m1G_MT domain-containing protein [Cephalotus follicularis]